MFTDARLPVSTPEAQGISSAAIHAFVDAVEAEIDRFHSFILLRHGHQVAAAWWPPYAPEHPHMLFSLSKSFASTAIGLAVAEGRLRVDDLVLDFFPEERPAEVSDNLAAMKVRHLLSMSTGHHVDTTGPMIEREDGNWAAGFFAQPVTHEPGTYFVYNSGATYMLSAIIQKLTGMTLLDYLTPRLFEPLGIEGATWQRCPRGINTGGWGLSIKTQDIACFGQLYLDQGRWQGKQIVPAAWVAEATAKQVSNGSNPTRDWEQGYGYQFWRCRHNAYRGDGAFGQYCIVMPDQDAVLAITSGVPDMQAVLNLVWAHLLPAMQDAPLPQDAKAHKALEKRLASLEICPPQGKATSPLAAQVSGRTYRFNKNKQGVHSLHCDFDRKGAVLTLQTAEGEDRITFGHGDWEAGTALFDRGETRPVMAGGAWTSPDTYRAQLCFYTTPFIATTTLQFEEDRVRYQSTVNVGFGAKRRPALVGRAK